MDRDGIAKLVADGVGLSTGDRVSVFVTDVSVIDYVEVFVKLCYQRGAHPQVVLTDERFDNLALRFADRDTLAEAPPIEAAAMEWSNVHVSFRAMVPPPGDAPDPSRAAALRAGRGIVSTMRWQGTRWALVRVPTPAWADRFGLPYPKWLAEWQASFDADWAMAGRRMQALCDGLARCNEVLIRDDDTELRLAVAGREWVPFSGQENWPDGEIATAPVETNVEGHIGFSGPIVFGATVIDGLSLSFHGGRVTDIAATQGREFVEQLVRGVAGADRVGEFGIGTNNRLVTLTHDLLIDEKILGTAHIALGRAYPECGGTNQSAIHWDIVKDLRGPHGRLEVDGLVLIADGVPTKALGDATTGGDAFLQEME